MAVKLNKIIITILCIMALPLVSFAGEDSFLKPGDKIKPDIIDKDKTNVYDRDGYRKGYFKKDIVDDKQINIYDKNGKRIGKMREDIFDPDTWEIEE